MRRRSMHVVAVMLILIVGAATVTGCFGIKKLGTEITSLRTHVMGGDFVIPDISSGDHLKYIAYAAAAMMVVGILVLASRKWIPGIITLLGGGGMAYTYSSLSNHPSISLIVPLGLLVVIAVLAVYLIRNRDVLRELIAAIEKHPRVKDDIGEGDPDRQARVKRVVTPIKEGMQKEGAI